MNQSEYVYVGNELDLFRHAENWKRYWSSHVKPYLGSRVLEVGAGMGVNAAYLRAGTSEWVSLEPDRKLATLLVEAQRQSGIAHPLVVEGVIHDLPHDQAFDSIIYIDVLEHIDNDAAEIEAASARLRPGGTLVVLSPAHNWLFSPYDRAIGHFRRYSPKTLRALTCPELELISLKQFDSIGTLASLANSIVLKSQMPKLEQILFWDRFMVPISRLVDPLLAYSFGRSIIGVWRRRP